MAKKYSIPRCIVQAWGKLNLDPERVSELCHAEDTQDPPDIAAIKAEERRLSESQLHDVTHAPLVAVAAT
jgi:hypothetical protein